MAFAKKWLRVDLWQKQQEILYSIAKNRKTAVKACHSSGKTFVAAVATLWWLARHKEGIVITTAPTDRQVSQLLWGEINALVEKSFYPFPKPLQTELKINSKRKAIGFTTSVDSGDEGTKFQGFHSSKSLIIMDEAPGVVGKLWNAVEGLLASGDARLLTLGNPTISSGPFYDSFGINKVGWTNFTISAFDTPNLKDITLDNLLEMTEGQLAVSKVNYLISRHWVRDRYKEWGPKHPLFVSRVLGDFASQSPDSLLSLDWLEKARNKPVFRTDKKLNAGIDVAGPGEDETVLVIRDGESIVSLQAWPIPDPRGELVKALLPYKDRIEVNVDSVGIGYYLSRHLEDLGFTVSDVNVGERSNDSEHFLNLKAQLYINLRLRLEAGEVRGLVDDLAISQLASIRYRLNSRGQVVIEGKDDAAKRGVKSPDRAEAIMLAFAPSFQHGLFGFWEEQSKELDIPQPVYSDSSSLANVQKEVAGFTERFEDLHRGGAITMERVGLKKSEEALVTESNSSDMIAVEQPKTLGKVMTSSEQSNICPGCGNKFLSMYGEGAWRCNACGTSSKDKL